MNLHGVRVSGVKEKMELPVDIDMDISALELQDALKYLREKYGNRQHRLPLFQAGQDAFSHTRPIFPTLLSDEGELTLSSAALTSEVRLVVEAHTDANVFSGRHIYRILVTQRVEPTTSVDESLPIPDFARRQLDGGYLLHDALYGCDDGTLTLLLTLIFQRSRTVDITVRAGAEFPTEHKTVHVKPGLQGPE